MQKKDKDSVAVKSVQDGFRRPESWARGIRYKRFYLVSIRKNKRIE